MRGPVLVCPRLNYFKAGWAAGGFNADMAKKFPIAPANPHRVCWGCDKYCPSDAMACGNGSVRSPHPAELFGEDWATWGLDAQEEADAQTAAPAS